MRSRGRPGEERLSSSLMAAFALMLVLEGILPFLMPGVWRLVPALDRDDRRPDPLRGTELHAGGTAAAVPVPRHILRAGSALARPHPHATLAPSRVHRGPPPGRGAARGALRRRILDLFRAHGYELVIPPLLEYLESLLTGTGHDLDLKTFKLVDQLSGRMLGIRADITPQVARIDAHLLNQEGIARLCYTGSVLHALLPA